MSSLHAIKHNQHTVRVWRERHPGLSGLPAKDREFVEAAERTIAEMLADPKLGAGELRDAAENVTALDDSLLIDAVGKHLGEGLRSPFEPADLNELHAAIGGVGRVVEDIRAATDPPSFRSAESRWWFYGNPSDPYHRASRRMYRDSFRYKSAEKLHADLAALLDRLARAAAYCRCVELEDAEHPPVSPEIEELNTRLAASLGRVVACIGELRKALPADCAGAAAGGGAGAAAGGK